MWIRICLLLQLWHIFFEDCFDYSWLIFQTFWQKSALRQIYDKLALLWIQYFLRLNRLEQFLPIEVFWQSDLINFRFVLKVFREDYLVDACPILWLPLQTLLNNHVKVFRHTLWDWIVFLSANFFLKFLNILSVVGVFVRAHFIQNDTQGPYIRCL